MAELLAGLRALFRMAPEEADEAEEEKTVEEEHLATLGALCRTAADEAEKAEEEQTDMVFVRKIHAKTIKSLLDDCKIFGVMGSRGDMIKLRSYFEETVNRLRTRLETVFRILEKKSNRTDEETVQLANIYDSFWRNTKCIDGDETCFDGVSMLPVHMYWSSGVTTRDLPRALEVMSSIDMKMMLATAGIQLRFVQILYNLL
tara:strand:+ start:651 stop:1256 length:606 start_codon:yes stop_codon:yes gene_type:complete